MKKNFRVCKELETLCLQTVGAFRDRLLDRFDGYWERELQAWDIAAGLLLVKEAGGMVAPIREGYDILEKGALLCANDPLFEPLKKIIRDE